ncbi:hypothetical protein H4219_003126 [Mycoemilia scoparia]|uniref:Major facilitator superfamily (MFS) profile domain-containing protein n=1 Tax=Mycoemilia scoparia TaxID=417184 RepID=A0A9W8DPP1_9FUNG|nr:hypothetical protein H4219_003126 [Mycoemilia scoparia]
MLVVNKGFMNAESATYFSSHLSENDITENGFRGTVMSLSNESINKQPVTMTLDQEKGVSSNSSTSSLVLDWELDEEEKKHLKSYYRKSDLRITLFFCIGYMLDFMTRISISGAKTVGIIEDLNLKESDFNVALSLFYIGHLLFHIPSNIILKATKPTLWMMFLLVGMGGVTMATAAATGKISLYLCRIAIGIIEAGYPAGSLYFFYSWFPRSEVGKRIGYLYSFAAVSNVIEGPINAGLSKIKSNALQQWQWVFLIIGILPCVWGIVGLFMVRDYPQTASFLTDEEKSVINKVLSSQGNKTDQKGFSWKQAKLALSDWNIWVCCVMGFAAQALFNAGALFGPVLLKSMGFSTEMANGLNAIPNIFGFLSLVFSGWIVNMVGSTGITQAVCEAVAAIGFILCVATTQKAALIAGLCIFVIATAPGMALAPAWVSSNQAGTTKPVIASALISAVASFGGFTTSYIYRDQDAPRYILGHAVGIALCGVVVVTSLLLAWLLHRENHKRENSNTDISHLNKQEIIDLCDRHPEFRYRI